MNSAHIHLLLNHFPIILLIVGFIILVVALIIKNKTLKITALVIFMCGSLITIPTFFSGENAEDVVENLPEVKKEYIENHEKQGQIFAILFYQLGIISFIGIWGISREKKFTSWFNFLILFFAAFSLYFAINTGQSGGEIRHSEIRKEVPTNGIEREKIEVEH